MDKIYNLQETIYNDKIAVKEIERELVFRKSILSAHEKALERLLSPKEYSPVLEKKVPQSITEKQETSKEDTIVDKERITWDNWTSLGIEVGDQVEIVVTNDWEFENGSTKEITGVEDTDYEEECCFLELEGVWYEADKNYNRDEIYLIRTKDGSGNY